MVRAFISGMVLVLALSFGVHADSLGGNLSLGIPFDGIHGPGTMLLAGTALLTGVGLYLRRRMP